MTKTSKRKIHHAMFLLYGVLSVRAHAQVFTTLVNFDGNEGYPYYMSLVQGHDGSFYGTTSSGGQQDFGRIFSVTADGTVTTIYSFCPHAPDCVDGLAPWGGLTLATDANLYGTTTQGGAVGVGTVFRVSAEGSLTTLHSFNGDNGFAPQTPPVQARDGYFYGAVFGGGGGGGVIFKSTGDGVGKWVYGFCPQPGNCSKGANPTMLLQGQDGNFYGTTNFGGSEQCPRGCGTVFKITADGQLTTLYVFCKIGGCRDGANPYGGLVQGNDGNFYGTTFGGGTEARGTVFTITPAGKLTTLYTFCTQTGCPDGSSPQVPMIEGTDGNYYGTTEYGGANSVCQGEFGGCGTIFRITSSGKLTTLHSFDENDGAFPNGLTQATSGIFYGTTLSWGQQDGGTVFTLDTGLGPFVAFVRSSGKVGQTGGILGQGFTGTTTVMLNGVPATFTVISDTFIKATVPPGATTGLVSVTTRSGVLTSNVPFHVIP